MKDIINQIIEIDALAFDNKTKNEQVLLKKKQELENMISSYHDEKLSIAKNKAEMIVEETDTFIMESEKTQKLQVQKTSAQIEKIYLNAEKDLTKKIFDKLFVLEG